MNKTDYPTINKTKLTRRDFQIGRALERSPRRQVWKPATRRTWKSALRFGYEISGLEGAFHCILLPARVSAGFVRHGWRWVGGEGRVKFP